jgi:hypothetical protein
LLPNRTQPFVRTYLGLFHLIEPRSCQGHSPAILPCKQYLKVLQRTGTESRDRSGKVQSPESNQFRSEAFRNLGRRVLKAFKPVLERPGVMRPHILDVGDRKIAWFEEVHHLLQSGRISSRENVLARPEIEGLWLIAADRLDQAATRTVEDAVQDLAHLAVVLRANVFQNADRNDSQTVFIFQ